MLLRRDKLKVEIQNMQNEINKLLIDKESLNESNVLEFSQALDDLIVQFCEETKIGTVKIK